MTTIIIKYKILDKQFEYSLDDKTFDKHLLAICDSAKCIGLSTNYVLSADGTNTIVQPMDLKKKPPKANDIFNLILSPKKCREIPSLREVIQSMADLDSGNMNRIKKAAFELMEKLKDSAWSETFRIQNGVPLLVKVIEKATGNLLAYSLRALESYIRAVFNLSFIRTTLMNKLLDSIFMSELNVVRPALNILALMTDPLTVDQAKGALLFIRSRRKQIDWSHIVQLLVNSDIGIQMATLTFINHMLNALSFEKDDGAAGINNTINGNNNSATPNIVVINEPSNNAKSQPTELEDFMDMLCDSIGILYILEKQTQIESLELRRQISIFQSYYLRRLTKNRGVPFDESRDEHMKLLTRLWNACFAGEQFQGVVSERWKEIGFQYKNPLTDLRSVGVMGLEHLLFYAETYSQNFLDKARVQQLKPFEFQYPLCVAGLHISQLLTVDVFQLTENDRKGPPNPDVRLVHPMLLQQEGLLNMYSIIFERLDLDWEIKRARYLEFAQIFEPIKLDVARILTEHGLLDLTKFKFLLLGAEHKDVIHPVIAANNLKHAPIGARLSMQVHPTSYYLELARKSDLFSEAIDIDLSPVSTPRRPSVSRDHATLESEDPFLKHRLKESGKRVTSMHVVSANDSRVVTPQVASSSPPLTPATESPRDKFLLSGTNRILSRSARNSAVPGASRSNDEFKELDYSMMETIKYTGPSTSEEWPQAMPIYLKKKVLAHNNTASDVNRSAADDAITTRKLSKVTRVKSAPDMSASIRKASIPREDPPKQQQTESKTTPVEQGAQGSPNRHLITNGANKDKSQTPTPTQSPQVSKIVTAAHVTAPPIPMKQSSKSQKTIARPPPPTSPRPLSLASKTNAVNPTSVAEASTVPEPHSDPAPSVQTQGSPPHDLRTPQPVTSTAHRPAVKTPHVIAEPVNVPQATDSLPPVKLGHTLVSRNSLPKKPAPPGSNTLRHVTSADNLAATVPKTSPVKTAPPKVPLSPKPALSSQPQQQGPLPKTAPAPAKKKFGPAPVKQLH
jgi:hypothetical protein